MAEDKIFIRDLRLFAYHGVNPEEKENGQAFIINVDVALDTSRACETDDVNDTVSYAQVLKTVRQVFCEKKYNLLEAAAQACADAVLERFEKALRVDISVEKPDAPIKADFGSVGVFISRGR